MRPVFFKGFTAQGLPGYGLFLAGIYMPFASLVRGDHMEQSDKARKLVGAQLRLLRWGVGGIGTFFFGCYVLLRAGDW